MNSACELIVKLIFSDITLYLHDWYFHRLEQWMNFSLYLHDWYFCRYEWWMNFSHVSNSSKCTLGKNLLPKQWQVCFCWDIFTLNIRFQNNKYFSLSINSRQGNYFLTIFGQLLFYQIKLIQHVLNLCLENATQIKMSNICDEISDKKTILNQLLFYEIKLKLSRCLGKMTQTC